MTSPQPPIIIQQPGLGQVVQRGLNPLIQGLQLRQQRQQEAQKIAIQQQQVELQEMSQRSQARGRAISQALQFVGIFGPDILEDPSLAQMLNEAGIKPQAVLKRFKEQQKQEADQLKIERETLMEGLPEQVQPGVKTFFGALDAGFDQVRAGELMTEMFESTVATLSPEDREALGEEFPSLFGPNARIPVAEAMEQLVAIRRLETEAAAGVGPEALRQLDIEKRRIDIKQAAKNLAGAVSLPDRLRAAIAFDNFISDLIQGQLPALVRRFGGGFPLQDRTEQVRQIYGTGSAIHRAQQQLSKVFAEALQSTQPQQ